MSIFPIVFLLSKLRGCFSGVRGMTIAGEGGWYHARLCAGRAGEGLRSGAWDRSWSVSASDIEGIVQMANCEKGGRRFSAGDDWSPIVVISNCVRISHAKVESQRGRSRGAGRGLRTGVRAARKVLGLSGKTGGTRAFVGAGRRCMLRVKLCRVHRCGGVES